jgi:hypothetical protein
MIKGGCDEQIGSFFLYSQGTTGDSQRMYLFYLTFEGMDLIAQMLNRDPAK